MATATARFHQPPEYLFRESNEDDDEDCYYNSDSQPIPIMRSKYYQESDRDDESSSSGTIDDDDDNAEIDEEEEEPEPRKIRENSSDTAGIDDERAQWLGRQRQKEGNRASRASRASAVNGASRGREGRCGARQGKARQKRRESISQHSPLSENILYRTIASPLLVETTPQKSYYNDDLLTSSREKELGSVVVAVADKRAADKQREADEKRGEHEKRAAVADKRTAVATTKTAEDCLPKRVLANILAYWLSIRYEQDRPSHCGETTFSDLCGTPKNVAFVPGYLRNGSFLKSQLRHICWNTELMQRNRDAATRLCESIGAFSSPETLQSTLQHFVSAVGVVGIQSYLEKNTHGNWRQLVQRYRCLLSPRCGTVEEMLQIMSTVADV